MNKKQNTITFKNEQDNKNQKEKDKDEYYDSGLLQLNYKQKSYLPSPQNYPANYIDQQNIFNVFNLNKKQKQFKQSYIWQFQQKQKQINEFIDIPEPQIKIKSCKQSKQNSFQDNHMRQQEDSVSFSKSKDNHMKSTSASNKKSEKNKIYTKMYRQKKKEELKSLQEENKFLKKKVEDLSFRLKQTELQLNKIKYEDSKSTINFHSIKDDCIKKGEKVLSQQTPSYKQVQQIDQKFKDLQGFTNKQRMDLLNYFMSQLLQNLVNDLSMYFLDCLQKKEGIWRQNSNKPLRMIDLEVFQIYEWDIDMNCKTNPFRQYFTQPIVHQLSKIKQLWKKLYQDYLNFIKHGQKLQNMCKPIFQANKHKFQVLNSLKLKLYFQKIKYRKDLRQIRHSWLKQIYDQKQDTKKCQQKDKIYQNKKCKVEIY